MLFNTFTKQTCLKKPGRLCQWARDKCSESSNPNYILSHAGLFYYTVHTWQLYLCWGQKKYVLRKSSPKNWKSSGELINDLILKLCHFSLLYRIKIWVMQMIPLGYEEKILLINFIYNYILNNLIYIRIMQKELLIYCKCEQVPKSNYEIMRIQVWFQPYISMWFQSMSWPFKSILKISRLYFQWKGLYIMQNNIM